ncbi:MAG: ABC transporter ATP-binding protein [Sedimentisphaerales bacterium]|jgi:branched-chain amino acid transport system ATP-binding protein|nr:ABC transporter ATP-binding protein [Sedimentisphaerales bacterium]NLZ05751.1 ABC transporter ATP-binding protein [Phycisphaerae bacterium]HNY78920.1 ABC transporter ATP-binding protein [Sedimentisphaerales bacterium]HOC62664.1 ABC transporter ATP-binding protein [Sedimentisphaerales bacterium]HOH64862.1 ABC transporter ATP-binding protein [Sedimentisphaerales bacterium]
MLRILNLEAGYGPLRVLKGISLHVSPGEAVAVIGANGAGKTTLLKTIAGVLKARSGEIAFDKQNIRGRPAEKIVAVGCSLVPEGRHVFGTMTVRENLLLGAFCRRHVDNSAGVDESLEQVYDLFGILKERSNQLAGTLSGGQQQMLAIGRALMSRPRLLMMDEPSLGVAPLLVQSIYEKIVTLKRNGLTILLVEQNARAALAVADRGYVIETGQIVLQGPSRQLSDNPEVQRAYLGKEYRRIDE